MVHITYSSIEHFHRTTRFKASDAEHPGWDGTCEARPNCLSIRAPTTATAASGSATTTPHVESDDAGVSQASSSTLANEAPFSAESCLALSLTEHIGGDIPTLDDHFRGAGAFWE